MESGYKTRQREQILQLLLAHQEEHFSVDRIVDCLRAQQQQVGRSTVYRYLEKLVQAGKARKYYIEEGAGACYQYAGEQSSCHEHFHLKCTSCGRLIHVECNYLEQVSEHVLAHHSFTIDHTKTVLYGLCADCAARGQA